MESVQIVQLGVNPENTLVAITLGKKMQSVYLSELIDIYRGIREDEIED